MERRTLGSSGLTVPVVGMGTWRTFDVRGDAATGRAAAIVETALAAGANFFDSSLPSNATSSASFFRSRRI